MSRFNPPMGERKGFDFPSPLRDGAKGLCRKVSIGRKAYIYNACVAAGISASPIRQDSGRCRKFRCVCPPIRGDRPSAWR